MTSYTDIQSLLHLSKPPVAIAFLDSPPDGVPAWNGDPVAAGCVFWKKAQEGEVFYTVASDHFNCAIGAYTHRLALPDDRAAELGQTLDFMVRQNYISLSEVPGIPTLSTAPRLIAYGPLDRVPYVPDVVVVAAQPAQAMMLYEAALKAEVSPALLNALGRPACAILPLTCNSGSASLSLGCAGNRSYTGLPDTELYVCIPGDRWDAVIDQIAVTLAANQAIETYSLERKAQFAPA